MREMTEATTGTPAGAARTPRIDAFDGLRGVLATAVAIAHLYGEVPHGLAALTFGWIAVKAFFVLSGFLMATVILENWSSRNFVPVFYVRRICRTWPLYFILIFGVFACRELFVGAQWIDQDAFLSMWRYLTFTHPFAMVSEATTGPRWFTPTWTLSIEEQFYLVAPLICFVAGRRYLVPVLAGLAVISIAVHGTLLNGDAHERMAGTILLVPVLHALLFGMIGGILHARGVLKSDRILLGLRIAPLALVMFAFAVKMLFGMRTFEAVGMPAIALACAAYLTALAEGAPEAQTMLRPRLRFLGQLSFGIYLFHMPINGLLHGLVLGGKPDIATPAQLAVTTAALALTIAVALVLNRLVEQPMIAFGRRFRFERRARPELEPVPA